MNGYYTKKRRSTLKVLDLLAAMTVIFLFYAVGLALVDAIDAEQEKHLLSPAVRTEVVARW